MIETIDILQVLLVIRQKRRDDLFVVCHAIHSLIPWVIFRQISLRFYIRVPLNSPWHICFDWYTRLSLLYLLEIVFIAIRFSPYSLFVEYLIVLLQNIPPRRIIIHWRFLPSLDSFNRIDDSFYFCIRKSLVLLIFLCSLASFIIILVIFIFFPVFIHLTSILKAFLIFYVHMTFISQIILFSFLLLATSWCLLFY